MAIRPILTIPDPILRKKAKPVERVDAELRRLMDDMLATMYDAPGIGLAAPQIGMSRRLDRHGPGQGRGARRPRIVMVNPEISSAPRRCACTRRAACRSPMSPPRSSARPRPALRYIDREGKQQEIELEGIWSTLVQHEIDHLNGVLFIDYLSRLKRDMVVRKFSKQKRARSLGCPLAAFMSAKCRASHVLAAVKSGGRTTGRHKGISDAHRLHGHARFRGAALRAIREAGHEVAAVYTQPPRAAGRGMALRKSPVQQDAEQAGLTVLTPERLKSAEEQERFRALNADAAVVVAYGLILPKPILEVTRHGAFNIHASLLPRWRGAAPINRAIMAGDRETGVTIMRIAEGLDTGPVCLEARIADRPRRDGRRAA